MFSKKTSTRHMRSAAAEPERVIVAPKGGARGAIKAGVQDRLTASWTPVSVSTNGEIRARLRVIRGRSREQFFNNDYAKNYYRKLKVNVIGPQGITLKSQPLDAGGKVDTGAKALIEAGFRKWGKQGVCDVTGKLSWNECLNLFIETAARDGEVFVRKVRGFDNGFGFAIQFIEADLVDEQYNAILPSGNVVRMGVEFNEWDRPVAYHVLRYDPADPGPFVAGMQYRERIPASEMKHSFITEFIRQGRGIPWGHAAMRRLRKLDEYEEAELEAAGTCAKKMGFFTESKDDDGTYEGSEETIDGELLTEAEAGTFEVLPPGVEFTPWDPQHPSGNFQPFRVGLLKAISAGYGINYASLGSDAADLSFSSLRHVTLEDRDLYKFLQKWVIENFCEWVFEDQLPAAMLTGQVPLPFAKLEKFRAHEFEPRSWDWVDPFKDSKAKSQELADKTTTLTDILAEKGVAIEDHCRKIQREQELEKVYQVNLGHAPAAPAQPV